VEPLAGWTVAVTADRRAAEQIMMLERRGATVIHAPVIRTLPLGPEAGRQEATAELIARPPDVLVAATGIGIRAWFGSSWTWGMGQPLADALAATTVVARGPKAAAAVVGEGLEVSWRASSETLGEVLEHLLAEDLAGRRVAVQLPGEPKEWFVGALRSAGAQVVELPVYLWNRPDPQRPSARLVQSILAGEIDVVTFTSAPAVRNFVALAGQDHERLRACLGGGRVVVACVGPLTGAVAVDAGAVDPVIPSPNRLGSMVRAIAERISARSRELDLDGSAARWQGSLIEVAGCQGRLTPLERAILETLVGCSGAVVSKQTLGRAAWGSTADEHTVEVAVNRLRSKLGQGASALQTTNRRGYRLVDRSAIPAGSSQRLAGRGEGPFIARSPGPDRPETSPPYREPHA